MWLETVNDFRKKLYLRYLAGFQMCFRALCPTNQFMIFFCANNSIYKMQSFLKIEKVIGETFHKELQSFKFIAIMITVDLFKIFWFSGIAGMHFFLNLHIMEEVL